MHFTITLTKVIISLLLYAVAEQISSSRAHIYRQHREIANNEHIQQITT